MCSFSPDPYNELDRVPRRRAPTHRNLSLWLAALAAFVSILTFTHNLTTSQSTPSAPSAPPLRRIVVGNRKLGPHYAGCDSVKLQRAITGIRVDPEGAARNVPPAQSDNVEDFDFSFIWPEGCPRPHLFTAAEACDVVGAFGALVLHGDSFTRQIGRAHV